MQGQIKLVDPLETKEWDGWITSFDDCCIFHSSSWAKVLKESYNYQPVYLCKITQSGPVALIPLMGVNSVVTGKRGVSLPLFELSAFLKHKIPVIY